MQLRQLLSFFDSKTKITIVSVSSQNHKTTAIITGKSIDDLMTVQSYYASLLDKNINQDTLTIMDDTLIIAIAD